MFYGMVWEGGYGHGGEGDESGFFVDILWYGREGMGGKEGRGGGWKWELLLLMLLIW